MLSATGLPAGASLHTSSGEFNWSPTFDQAGPYPVVFSASDGDLTVDETLTMMVQNVNRPPALNATASQTIAAGTPLAIVFEATDPDRDPLLYSMGGLPEGASFDALSHTMHWTPTVKHAGIHRLMIAVSDGALEATDVFTLTVTVVNQPPVLAPLGPFTTRANHRLRFQLVASDPDGDLPIYGAVNLPRGAVLDSRNGKFFWKPKMDQKGTHTVTFTASDGHITSQTVVTIRVIHPGKGLGLKDPDAPNQGHRGQEGRKAERSDED
jgi:hypothetical protein